MKPATEITSAPLRALRETSPSESHLDFYRRWGRMAGPYFQWQYDQFAPHLGRRVADVGCGLGNFVPFLQDRDLYLGLELDPELAQEFRRMHTSGRIRLAEACDITDPRAAAELQRNAIDSVICVNVLEHIEDHARALAHLVDGVTPGGHVCVLVPALQWLYGTLDKLDGHFRRYSRKQLARLANGLPVRILKLYYLNFIGAFGWFLKGRILKQQTQSNGDYAAMNRILPIVSRLEKLAHPPLGMSVIMILQKEL